MLAEHNQQISRNACICQKDDFLAHLMYDCKKGLDSGIWLSCEGLVHEAISHVRKQGTIVSCNDPQSGSHQVGEATLTTCSDGFCLLEASFR